MKDGSLSCTCSMGMFGCSIHPSGRDAWIASMRASLVRTFRSQVLAQALMVREAACGQKSSVLLTKYDRQSCSWRTAQQSLLEDSTVYSETWPSWGSMRNGVCFLRPQSVPRTFVLDGGASRETLLPTPTATTAKQGIGSKAGGASAGRPLLARAALMWPTPTVNDAKNSTLPPSQIRHDNIPGAMLRRGEKAGGQLNPVWVEWLMGWPLGSTASRRWVMARCRSRQQRHT